MENKEVKEKNVPAFRSNAYSFWRYLAFALAGFVGGQTIGGGIGYAITFILPVFREGGLLHPYADAYTTIIAFAVTFLFILLMLKVILKTDFKSTVTGNRPYKIGYAVGCAAVYLAVTLIYVLIRRDSIRVNPAPAAARIISLILVLLFVPMQTTAEELVFRTTLGRLFIRNEQPKNIGKILGISLLSGALFLAPHLANPEVAAYGMVVALFSYFLVGFMLMLISLLTGSFEGALAIHAINNIYAMMFVTGEVSAVSFPAFFVEADTSAWVNCVLYIALYTAVLLWTLLYKKKYMTEE